MMRRDVNSPPRCVISTYVVCCCVQYLDTMADIVRQGIVKAVEDLEKENQEKLMQEVWHFLK